MLEGFDDDGTPRTRPPRRAITLRHLLTHTAGFSYEIWSDAIVRYQEATGTPGVMSCENAALTTPPLFDPGDRWDYGINIDWAGKLVEAVSGQRLGDYLREHLLGPLGMSDTAFRITDEMRARLARIHQRGEDGTLEPRMALEIPQDPEFEMGRRAPDPRPAPRRARRRHRRQRRLDMAHRAPGQPQQLPVGSRPPLRPTLRPGLQRRAAWTPIGALTH